MNCATSHKSSEYLQYINQNICFVDLYISALLQAPCTRAWSWLVGGVSVKTYLYDFVYLLIKLN